MNVHIFKKCYANDVEILCSWQTTDVVEPIQVANSFYKDAKLIGMPHATQQNGSRAGAP